METTSRLQRESTGEWIVVARDREIAAGGQSRVYPVEGRAEWVAKLYVAPAEEQARKLAVMLARTPGTGEAKGVRLVWPFDVLRDSDHQLAGLLVPRVAGSHRIFELYNPATRRRVAPLFHWGLLHRTALRLARAFGALHEAGYVVGDVNESNILVDERGDVAVIDTDSFQVPDPDGGAVHLCPVGRPEFTPPELQGRLFPELVRSELHDRFGLGVLLFQTLMEGTHPFAGRWWGPGEPPPLAARIAAGAYPYDEAGRREALPPRTAPAIGILHPALQALFRRCFVEGHADPGARPSPAEWADALEEAAADLVECRRNASHLHASHLPECPWCARTRLLRGRDPFPAARAVARGAHLPAPRAPARWRGGAAARVRAGAGPRVPLRRQLRNPWIWCAILVTSGVFFPFLVGPVLPWPVSVALLAVGWWRSMRRPGRPIAFAGIGTLAVLLMVGVALARWRTAGVWTPPVGRPAVPASAVADPTTVYLPEALSLRPRPLNPDLLRTAVEDLRARTDGPPGVTVRFVVLADGAVDPSSVSVSSEDSAGVQTLRSRLMAARFRPGSAWGHPVPVLVAFPVRWDRGQPVARLDDATWNVEMDPGQEVQAPVIESGGLALDKLDSRPELLNKTEVSQMLSRSYPPLLQEAGIGGKAVIQFVTARDGTVDPNSITIVSSTHEQFAQASARVVSMFRFRPGYYHGKPVRVQVRLPITWQPMP